MAFTPNGRARLLLSPPEGGLLTTRQASLDAADRLVAPPKGLLTLGFDPTRFQTEPPACYRASWQLPGRDSHPLATTSLCQITIYIIALQLWAHPREVATAKTARPQTHGHKTCSIRTPPRRRALRAHPQRHPCRRARHLSRAENLSRLGRGGPPADSTQAARQHRRVGRRATALAAGRRTAHARIPEVSVRAQRPRRASGPLIRQSSWWRSVVDDRRDCVCAVEDSWSGRIHAQDRAR